MSTPYPSLGKYQIIQEIGRGGMGAVYKAHDPFLNRTVAIKVLAPHLVWQQTFVDRFLREARAVAQLRHPNIVDVHDVGQEGGNYYFVMAFLPGQSLTHLIGQRGRLRPAETLPILRQLADALDYAHSKGLIHRDVKPANVMFDERGQAVLTDFGIVKAAQESRLTTAGVSIGTPHYMAPEQIQGKDIDARTDQYALGIIAFEMLTGCVPFDAATTTAILYKQVNEPPPSVTAFCPDLPPGVQIALSRALSKSPAERFASCGEFVSALQQAVSQPARPVAPPAPVQLVRPAEPKRQATPAPRAAAQPRLVATGPARAGGGVPVLLLVGAGIVALALIALVVVALVAVALSRKPTPTVPLPAAAISPDNAAKTVTLARLGIKASSMAFSPDGKWMASGSDDKAIKLWDTSSWREAVIFIGRSNRVTSVAFSPDGKLLASGSDEKTVQLWDVPGKREQRTLVGHTGTVWSVAFSPDGKLLASASDDDTVKLWDVSSGREVRTLVGHAGPVYSVAFSPDGKTLASGATDRTVKLWDVSSGRELRALTGHGDYVNSLAFAPDGKTLVSGSRDKIAKLWDVSSGRELTTLRGHTGWVMSVAFSPNGKILATGSSDQTIKMWDVSSGRELCTLSGHTGRVYGLAFLPAGKLLMSGSDDGTLGLWGVQ